MSELLTEDAEEYPFDYELPVNGSELPEILTAGLEFGPFAHKDKLRPARLPVGWAIQKLNNKVSVIVDQYGSRRIAVYTAAKLHMRSHTRFYHGRDMFNKDFDTVARFCVWDRAKANRQKEQVIFEKSFGVPSAKRNKAVHDGQVSSYFASNHCGTWLEENYPNWDNHNAYWDDYIR